MSKCTFHVYAFCWNEAPLIPAFLKHYEQADRIVVYDNMSTDGSPDMIRAAGREVVSYDTGEKLDDFTHCRLRNTMWHESIGKADYVIVQDLDEFVHFPRFPNNIRMALTDLKDTGCTAAQCLEYTVIMEDDEWVSVLDNLHIPPVNHILRGQPSSIIANSSNYDKVLVFNPTKIPTPNIGIGGHHWDPVGEVVMAGTDQRPFMLHFKHLGQRYEFQRRSAMRERLRHQFSKGMSNQYDMNDAYLANQIKQWHEQPVVDIFPALFNDAYRYKPYTQYPSIALYHSNLPETPTWKSEVTTYIAAKCKECSTILVDIEAEVGYYSFAALLAGANHVYSFNSDLLAVERLLQNSQINGLASHMTIGQGLPTGNINRSAQILIRLGNVELSTVKEINHLLSDRGVSTFIVSLSKDRQPLEIIEYLSGYGFLTMKVLSTESSIDSMTLSDITEYVTTHQCTELVMERNGFSTEGRLISADDILQHPSYISSNNKVKSFTMKTFHHHYHILLPILHLTQAKTYMELGTFGGGSLKLATSYEGLEHAVSVDTYEHFTCDQVLANVGSVKCRISLCKAYTDDKNVLRNFYRNKAPLVDVLFIDAGHTYKNVMDDFANYYALVRPGGVIVFDDYGDNVYSPDVRKAVDEIVLATPSLHVIGVLPNKANSFGNNVPYLVGSSNEFIVQKPYLPPPTTFGICTATYNHGRNGAVKKMLASLKDQTFTDWTLFLVGDKHTDEPALSELLSVLPPEKVVFTNLPIACERDFTSNKHALYTSGGATAMNYATELIKHSKCKYIAHLDDDDIWAPNHLEVIAAQYQRDPTLSFVFTRGLHVTGEIIPRTDSNIPKPTDVLHSAISWNPAKLTITLPYDSTAPADAIMLAEIADKCRKGTHKSYMCPVTTVTHLDESTHR